MPWRIWASWAIYRDRPRTWMLILLRTSRYQSNYTLGSKRLNAASRNALATKTRLRATRLEFRRLPRLTCNVSRYAREWGRLPDISQPVGLRDILTNEKRQLNTLIHFHPGRHRSLRGTNLFCDGLRSQHRDGRYSSYGRRIDLLRGEPGR